MLIKFVVNLEYKTKYMQLYVNYMNAAVMQI